jgi:hypothetical protein
VTILAGQHHSQEPAMSPFRNDAATRFGVFYPRGYLILAFADQDDAENVGGR